MLDGIDSKTDVDGFLSELGAGTLKAKIAHLLSGVANGVVVHGRSGELTLKFSIKQFADNDQVMITSTLSHKTPTKRGHKGELDASQMPMFVGRHGVLTVSPPKEDSHGQANMFIGDKPNG